MPNIKSAKKRCLVTSTKTLQNKIIKSELKSSIKKFDSLAQAGEKEAAKAAYLVAVKKIEKAEKNNIIHKNNSNRKKSALTLKLNKLACRKNLYRKTEFDGFIFYIPGKRQSKKLSVYQKRAFLHFLKKKITDTAAITAAAQIRNKNAALSLPCTIIRILAVRPELSVTVIRDLPQTPACTIPERSTTATKTFEE